MNASAGPPLAFQATAFIYLKIPVVGGQESADHSLDEAIDEALQQRGLGTVLGWGSSLGLRRANGSRPVAFHRIDMEVRELHAARAGLHQVLPTLEVPAGSELHYFIDDRHLMDLYEPPSWRLQQAVAGP